MQLPCLGDNIHQQSKQHNQRLRYLQLLFSWYLPNMGIKLTILFQRGRSNLRDKEFLQYLYHCNNFLQYKLHKQFPLLKSQYLHWLWFLQDMDIFVVGGRSHPSLSTNTHLDMQRQQQMLLHYHKWFLQCKAGNQVSRLQLYWQRLNTSQKDISKVQTWGGLLQNQVLSLYILLWFHQSTHLYRKAHKQIIQLLKGHHFWIRSLRCKQVEHQMSEGKLIQHCILCKQIYCSQSILLGCRAALLMLFQLSSQQGQPKGCVLLMATNILGCSELQCYASMGSFNLQDRASKSKSYLVSSIREDIESSSKKMASQPCSREGHQMLQHLWQTFHDSQSCQFQLQHPCRGQLLLLGIPVIFHKRLSDDIRFRLLVK